MIVRGFWIVEGRQVDFEKVFGLDGIWSEFLRRSERYLGTELRLESRIDRQYKVRDYWQSHRDFEQFRAAYQHEFEQFSFLLSNEGLIEREEILGSFYTGDSDEDVVPS